MEELQTGNPRELVLHSYFYSIHYDEIEKQIHAQYPDSHIRGEWFFVNDEIIATLMELFKLTHTK